MESDPNKDNCFKAASKEHVQKKILVDEEEKKLNSSSSSSEKSEESKTNSNYTKIYKGDSERPAPSPSPDDNCAICFQNIQDQSFTNTCNHIFCFHCLFKWSKQKAECPLCKRQFGIILHNIRENHKYDEFVLRFKGESWGGYFRLGQEWFENPTTMNPFRNLEINGATDQEYQGRIDFHRMIFTQHVPSSPSMDQIISQLPILYRSTIYEQNLYAKAPSSLGYRLATPGYYKIHPPCLHRLIHWLNRELSSIWRDNEADVNSVLKLFNSLLEKHEIMSQEFRIQIEPYLGSLTHHFIHELYSFATSLYDMECYDELVDYVLVPHPTDGAEHFSPYNDSNAIFTGENSSLMEQNRESGPILMYLAIKRLMMSQKKQGNGNTWQPNRYPSSSSSDPSLSTSGFTNNFPFIDGNPRAPEIVDLSSDEE